MQDNDKHNDRTNQVTPSPPQENVLLGIESSRQNAATAPSCRNTQRRHARVAKKQMLLQPRVVRNETHPVSIKDNASRQDPSDNDDDLSSLDERMSSQSTDACRAVTCRASHSSDETTATDKDPKDKRYKSLDFFDSDDDESLSSLESVVASRVPNKEELFLSSSSSEDSSGIVTVSTTTIESDGSSVIQTDNATKNSTQVPTSFCTTFGRIQRKSVSQGFQTHAKSQYIGTFDSMEIALCAQEAAYHVLFSKNKPLSHISAIDLQKARRAASEAVGFSISRKRGPPKRTSKDQDAIVKKPVKRKRGRPPKRKSQTADETKVGRRKRGRPAKRKSDPTDQIVKRKQGRPAKRKSLPTSSSNESSRSITRKKPPRLGDIWAVRGKFEMTVRYQGKKNYIGTFSSRPDAECAQVAAHKSLVALDRSMGVDTGWTPDIRKNAIQEAKQAARNAVAGNMAVSKTTRKSSAIKTPQEPPNKNKSLGSIAPVGENKFQVYIFDQRQCKKVYVGRFISRKSAQYAQSAAHASLVSFYSSMQNTNPTANEIQHAVEMAKQAARQAVANEIQQQGDVFTSSVDTTDNTSDGWQEPSQRSGANKTRKYDATVNFRRKRRYVGRIDSLEDVKCARKAARASLTSCYESITGQDWTAQERNDAVDEAKQAARRAVEARNRKSKDKDGTDQHGQISSNGVVDCDIDGRSCRDATCSTTQTSCCDEPSIEEALQAQELVGSRVYCRWPDNNEWYWGTITDKARNENSDKEPFYYSVQFDDGDFVEKVEPHHAWTVQSYRRIFEREPPPPPEEFRHLSLAHLPPTFDHEEQANEVKEPVPTCLAPRLCDFQEIVEKRICQEWTDVQGRNKIVYGHVTGFEVDPNEEKETLVIVKYSDKSRKDANSMANPCGTTVPRSRKISFQLALGAVASFEGRNRRPQIGDRQITKPSLNCWTWFTPECREKEMVDAGCGLKLPRLTLAVRGFVLEFSVRKSTIPGAGYGVFVRAEDMLCSIDGQERKFELQQGEFVDLGIYAPFHKGDRKKKHVFLLKNFIHSFKCEEWCFNADDEEFDFDIADDFTGHSHDAAQSNIPAYVNECNARQRATICAQYDPEGNVHYLFGVVEGGKLSLPGNEVETELFINYGPKYELVRLRKGYSDLPSPRQQELLRELEENDEEYLEEMENFALEEVCDCVAFFQDMLTNSESEFLPARALDVRVGQRALVVSRILAERVKSLEESGEDVPSGLFDSASALVSMFHSFFGKGDKGDEIMLPRGRLLKSACHASNLQGIAPVDGMLMSKGGSNT